MVVCDNQRGTTLVTGWTKPKSNKYVLVTWARIGEYLGVSARQCMRYHQTKGLPVFFIGKYAKAHKEILMLWMHRQEKN